MCTVLSGRELYCHFFPSPDFETGLKPVLIDKSICAREKTSCYRPAFGLYAEYLDYLTTHHQQQQIALATIVDYRGIFFGVIMSE